MVSTKPERGLRTDEEYERIAEYAAEAHPQLPEVFEWPRGWVHDNPMLLFVALYRCWLRDCKTRERRRNPPVSFVEWQKQQDRASERERRRDLW